jgi:hypothetical protein
VRLEIDTQGQTGILQADVGRGLEQIVDPGAFSGIRSAIALYCHGINAVTGFLIPEKSA